MEAITHAVGGARQLARDTGEFSDYSVRCLRDPRAPWVFRGRAHRQSSSILNSHTHFVPFLFACLTSPYALQNDLWLFFGIQFFFFAVTPVLIMLWRLLINWRDGFMGMFKVRSEKNRKCCVHAYRHFLRRCM